MRSFAKNLMVWTISFVMIFGFTTIAYPNQKVEAATISTTTIRSDALDLVGKPYKYGGESPTQGFDTTGLVYYVYQNRGIDVPRDIDKQKYFGDFIGAYKWRYGDVLFFTNDGSSPDFVGIYVGSGKFVSVPKGGKVGVYSLTSSYFKKRYLGARRFLTATTTSTVSTASSYTTADKIIALGDRYLGTPYQYGAPSLNTSTFDCSSFTQYVFYKNGIKLPRTSSDQTKVGTYIPWGQWKKGDLLFYSTSYSGGKVAHVAIYAGDGKILHTYGSPGVTYTSVYSSWWKAHYKGAKRVIN